MRLVLASFECFKTSFRRDFLEFEVLAMIELRRYSMMDLFVLDGGFAKRRDVWLDRLL